jgi:hypothetical protein
VFLRCAPYPHGHGHVVPGRQVRQVCTPCGTCDRACVKQAFKACSCPLIRLCTSASQPRRCKPLKNNSVQSIRLTNLLTKTRAGRHAVRDCCALLCLMTTLLNHGIRLKNTPAAAAPSAAFAPLPTSPTEMALPQPSWTDPRPACANHQRLHRCAPWRPLPQPLQAVLVARTDLKAFSVHRAGAQHRALRFSAAGNRPQQLWADCIQGSIIQCASPCTRCLSHAPSSNIRRTCLPADPALFWLSQRRFPVQHGAGRPHYTAGRRAVAVPLPRHGCDDVQGARLHTASTQAGCLSAVVACARCTSERSCSEENVPEGIWARWWNFASREQQWTSRRLAAREQSQAGAHPDTGMV